MNETASKNNITPEQNFLVAYDSYAKPLWRHAYFRVGSREQAEDLVSETFVRAWNSYRERPINNLRSLLYRILHNLIIDSYRAARPTISIDVLSELPDMPNVSHADVVERQTMENCLKKLPDLYRQVLLFRYVDDLPASEISRLVGKSTTHVYVIIHRALRDLRKLARN